jgi:hypothetical protein
MIGYEDLTWTGDQLRYHGRTLATLEPAGPKAVPRQAAGRPPDRHGQPDAREGCRQVSRHRHFKYPRETQRSPRIRYCAPAVRGHGEHLGPFQGGTKIWMPQRETCGKDDVWAARLAALAEAFRLAATTLAARRETESTATGESSWVCCV